MSTPSPSVTHVPERRSFETPDGAHLSYVLTGDSAAFVHTFVPPELRRQGLAAALTRAALAHARTAGWQVVPACSYVQAYLQRNSDVAAAPLPDGRPFVASS